MFPTYFDNDIFIPPNRERVKLSRTQKRANAAARLTTRHENLSTNQKLAELTSKQLVRAQQEDGSLTELRELAKDGEENYLMKNNILYHSSEISLERS